MRTILAGVVAAAVVSAGLAVVAAPADAHSVPACGDSALRVKHSASQGAMGHGNLVLRFRNISDSTCSLTGYPGFDALDSDGQVLKHAKRTLRGFTGGADSVETIVLRPNHFASADVEWVNFKPNTGGSCTWSDAIGATPANTTLTAYFPESVSVCRLQVHPTVKGKSGNS